jgi:probable O-glycosylation ligase (exosortase A-associated)
MRDIAILLILFGGMLATIRWPYVGILLWTWLTLMDPHQQAFGFSRNFPVNLLIAIVTILTLMFSKENKKPPLDANLWFTSLFLVWITINGFQAVDPAWSWPLWDRTWRIIVLGILVSITATNRTRIHALLLTMVLSLMYYGVKGGLFTLMTGGHFSVVGPEASTIGDNNQLALAILMAIPLVNYVRLHSATLWVRQAALAAMILSMISVLGSYSRGAFIALAGLLVVAWFRAKHKWLYPLLAAAVVIPAYNFMPEKYVARISTIQDAQSDGSFQGRVTAWRVAWGYARDHFPFGAGFSGPELPQIFDRYAPGADTHAAHSIYFQVLGDNGWVGLLIYLAILFLCFWNSFQLRKATKRVAEMAWIYDLVGMLQLTLFTFCVGGAALSFAYYDVLFISAGLLSALRVYVARHMVARVKFGAQTAFSAQSPNPAPG